MPHQLVINGITYGNLETLNATQSYGRVEGGRSSQRMADGSLVSQCFWSKISTTLTGTGVIPPGLDALDEGISYTIKCLGPRTISSSVPSITLPTRRSDVAVEYSAWVGGELVDWDGLSVVAGAQAYRATYVPEITARLVAKSVNGDIYSARWAWSLTFEEI